MSEKYLIFLELFWSSSQFEFPPRNILTSINNTTKCFCNNFDGEVGYSFIPKQNLMVLSMGRYVVTNQEDNSKILNGNHIILLRDENDEIISKVMCNYKSPIDEYGYVIIINYYNYLFI